MVQSSSDSSCSCALRTRQLDSSFVERCVNQRGRKATDASTSLLADLWRDVWCEIDAWGGLGDTLSVLKVTAHTTPKAVLAGVITPDDRAGNVRAARLSVNLAVTRMLTGSRALILRDSVRY